MRLGKRKTFEYEVRAVVVKRVRVDAENKEQAERTMHNMAHLSLKIGEAPTVETLTFTHIGTIV